MAEMNLSVKEFFAQQTDLIQKSLSVGTLERKAFLPIITICMDPGSGGHLIAQEVANRLGLRLYDKKLLTLMANMADLDRAMLNNIEKQRPAQVHDFISCLLEKDYVFTGSYLENLKRAVQLIADVGNSIIVGRGANFILPPQGRFSIRVVAPLDVRVRNVAFRFGVSLDEARKRIKHRESRRKTFVRESFHEQIEDVGHYDLIINTGRMDMDTSVETAIGAIMGAQANRTFNKDIAYILRNGNE